jgi:hypothetical protein
MKVVIRVIFQDRPPLEFTKDFPTIPLSNTMVDLSTDLLQRHILCEDEVFIKSTSCHASGLPLLVTDEIDYHHC